MGLPIVQPEIINQFAPLDKTRLIQVSYRTGTEERTCTRFSRVNNEVKFITQSNEEIVFDLTGRTQGEYIHWIQNRLDNFTNSKVKLLIVREIIEEIE